MGTYKLANILLEDTRPFHEAPMLYVRSQSFVVPSAQGIWQLGKGLTDFTTFFNALSVGKWRKYTLADEFSLHLELRGGACAVELMCAAKSDTSCHRMPSSRIQLEASDAWQTVDIPVRDKPGNALVGFVIEAGDSVELRDACWNAQVAASDIRPVELAIATTTFKKEDYIQHNINLVRARILSSHERAAGHVSMHVVDNGRTLDAHALSGDGITVHPNDNVGGAGGFARGMIHAMEQDKPATHVLLMDDDVEVSPESILRTWNLLSVVRDEWKEAFVAGAMMSWDEPDYRWEDGGVMTEAGVCGMVKPPLHMSSLRNVIASETFTPNNRSFPDLVQRYAAWWYCCIPTDTIRRNGMPLPLFVRYDDAEYGMRCKPQFITMNGICIWHLDFALRFNPATELYQTARNSFIINATTGVAPLSDFEGQLVQRMRFELCKFNYTDALLLLDGFEDFLKGPGFFSAKGVAAQTYLDANRRREQLLPHEELREAVLQKTGIDIDDYDANDITSDVPLGLTLHASPFRVSRMQTLQHSLNGQLFGKLKPYAGKVAVICANNDFPTGKIYGADTIVAIDVPSGRGAIRHRDNERAKAIWARLQQDLKEYHHNKAELEALYQEARPLITSVEYWKQYLDME